ncbi:hypothetical protein HYT25_03940 [Candidatus Pacearchaeota archaeon]|nr:hypothetical protein [Candidatus Pacearchaeota archaeon]
MKKRGNILTENIVFILLTLIFFAIIITFIFSRSGGSAILEEELAKQTALLIDSAKPGMIIKINVEDALEKAKAEKYSQNIITIQGNTVTAKLREKGGYSYSFFNEFQTPPSIFPDTSSDEIKDYVIFVD